MAVLGAVFAAWFAWAPMVASAAEPAKPATTTSPAPSGLGQNLTADVHLEEVELADLGNELVVRFRAAMASVPQLPSEFANAITREVPGGAEDWLGRAALSAVIAIVIGYIAARLFEHFAQKTAQPAPAGSEDGFSVNARIAFLLRRLFVWIIGCAILVGVGYIVLQVLDRGIAIEQRTAFIPLLCVGIARGLLCIVRTLFTPFLPQYRLVHIDTENARGLYRDFAIFVVAAVIIGGFDAWLEVLSLPKENRQLVAIALSLILVVLISLVCILHRHTIARILVSSESKINPLLRSLASVWWVFAVAYFVFGWLLRCVNVLLGIKGGSTLITTPIMLLVVGFIGYGVARLILAKLIRQSSVLRVGTGAQARRLRDFLDLSYDAAAWLILLACVLDLARAWGVSFDAGSVGALAAKVGLIIIAGAVLYEGVRIAIDRKLAREGGMGPVYLDDSDDDEPIRAGQSRIATILPLIRVFALGIIATLIVMMVLSELGVQVAPLLAGASIFGLAIGFGSQTLVHDVLSGAFFLVDDAFRVGEYVDLGGGIKGTVEKISIRSFQLRHQNGPLHTIQFGNIKQVTNFSRDWALTKIPFQFALGTDIEKVRKIVKRVGQELATDPATAHLFLMPLKSQGVSEVSGNGVTVRVKFMSQPADSSMASRAVLARLHQAFLDAKIEFPNTAMTVRIDNPGPALTPEQESQAVTAALAQQQAAAAAVATPT